MSFANSIRNGSVNSQTDFSRPRLQVRDLLTKILRQALVDLKNHVRVSSISYREDDRRARLRGAHYQIGWGKVQREIHEILAWFTDKNEYKDSVSFVTVCDYVEIPRSVILNHVKNLLIDSILKHERERRLLCSLSNATSKEDGKKDS